MPINSFLYPAPSNSDNFEVANSLRFDDGSSDSLNRTPSSAGNRRTWTWSCWLKRSVISSGIQTLFRVGQNDQLRFNSSDQLDWYTNNASARLITNRLFRDSSAWYHIVVAMDTTQATDSNRMKIYINGVQETSLSTSNYPSENFDTDVNNTTATGIGYAPLTNDEYFDGYMAEVVIIDGTALTPTSFGEFDSANPTIWKPKEILTKLDFGTNGFYLQFKNSSSLGTDSSTGGNNFTVNNLTSIDQTEDTCTNNWCTQNPLSYRSGQTVPTYSEGNLKVVYAAGVNTFSYGTQGVQAGKWYWEVKVTFGSNVYTGIGFASAATNTDINGYLLRQTGQIYNTSGSASSYASALSSGDIVMVAFDADNGTLWFGVNGTWLNSATQSEIENGTTSNSAFSSIDMSSIWLPLSKGGVSSNSNTQSNFGNEIYSISSGNADANGHGNFEYSVPSGYFALCSKNLAEFG
tara:strand:- start:2144 stop:3532 length:1389 start_codon:yes stop_codon:yes gene_type:complete